MERTTIYNPVKVSFGRNSIENLPSAISKYGKKILLVYGKGSIKKNGLHEKIMKLVADFQVFEYAGIKPNPVVADVNEAAKIANLNDVDVILAVGGGSVIDSAKVIAATAFNGLDGWKVMTNSVKLDQSKILPVIAVLTLAATGTEMNPYAVIQNPETGHKIGWGNIGTYPRESFLDPELTFSVSKEYTAFGLADMVAHCLEQYFGSGNSPLTDKFTFAVINEVKEIGEDLIENLNDYNLRARAMYAGTMALNGLLAQGRSATDWGVHSIGHQLSFLYDTPHGASLSIAYPAWMKLMSGRIPERIVELGRSVFGVETVEETIEKFELFFQKIGCPTRLSHIGIGKDKETEISEFLNKNSVSGAVHKLDIADRAEILKLMW